MRWNTNMWTDTQTETHCTTWQCLQSWYWGSHRTNLVDLLGWGWGKACVAMETLTDGALVLSESWAGLWNNISCFISLPLSSSCPIRSFLVSSVSLFVLFYSCSLWQSRYLGFLIWLQHSSDTPSLLFCSVYNLYNLLLCLYQSATCLSLPFAHYSSPSLWWGRLKCMRDEHEGNQSKDQVKIF